MCVMRTAVSTLFTFWPPLPPERKVSTCNSIGRNDDFGGGLFDFGDGIHAGKTGVPAFVGIEWRNADQPMHAAFGFAKAIGIFAL